jgi:hypothetical protein
MHGRVGVGDQSGDRSVGGDDGVGFDAFAVGELDRQDVGLGQVEVPEMAAVAIKGVG